MKKLAYILAIVLTVGLCATARAATVRLRARADVPSRVVTLADVARITGANAELHDRLQAIVIDRIDETGRSLTVEADRVRRRIYEHGVNMALVLVKGSASTTVRLRAGETHPVESTSTEPARIVDPLLGNAAMERKLTALIADWVMEHTSLERGAFEIEFAAKNAVPNVSESTELTVVKPKAIRFGARNRFEFAGSEGTTLLEVPAAVHLLQWQVVAVQDLRPGSTVRAEDLRRIRRRADVGSGAGFTEIDQVVGLKVLRPVSAGQPVVDNSVRQAILVERGEVVTMRMRTGSAVMTRRVQARVAGSRGQVIELSDVDDRKSTYRGTVVDRGVVELLP